MINHFTDEKNEAQKLPCILITWALSGWGRCTPTQSAPLTTIYSGQDHPLTVPWDIFENFPVRINCVGTHLKNGGTEKKRMEVLYSTVFLTGPAKPPSSKNKLALVLSAYLSLDQDNYTRQVGQYLKTILLLLPNPLWLQHLINYHSFYIYVGKRQ